MSDKLNIGQIIEGEAERDATHIALAPVVAGKRLSPGAHIGFRPDGRAYDTKDVEFIGVVDPFLTRDVTHLQKFWMFLYPGTIKGLRHEWSHPAFNPSGSPKTPVADAEKWLKDYAVHMNVYASSPEDAWRTLKDGLNRGEIFADGSDLHGLSELRDAEEFFRNAEIFLGRKLDPETFEYSCSC